MGIGMSSIQEVVNESLELPRGLAYGLKEGADAKGDLISGGRVA